MNPEKKIKIEVKAELVNNLINQGVPPDCVQELAIPLSEWILGQTPVQPCSTDGKE